MRVSRTKEWTERKRNLVFALTGFFLFVVIPAGYVYFFSDSVLSVFYQTGLLEAPASPQVQSPNSSVDSSIMNSWSMLGSGILIVLIYLVFSGLLLMKVATQIGVTIHQGDDLNIRQAKKLARRFTKFGDGLDYMNSINKYFTRRETTMNKEREDLIDLHVSLEERKREIIYLLRRLNNEVAFINEVQGSIEQEETGLQVDKNNLDNVLIDLTEELTQTVGVYKNRQVAFVKSPTAAKDAAQSFKEKLHESMQEQSPQDHPAVDHPKNAPHPQPVENTPLKPMPTTPDAANPQVIHLNSPQTQPKIKIIDQQPPQNTQQAEKQSEATPSSRETTSSKATAAPVDSNQISSSTTIAAGEKEMEVAPEPNMSNPYGDTKVDVGVQELQETKDVPNLTYTSKLSTEEEQLMLTVLDGSIEEARDHLMVHLDRSKAITVISTVRQNIKSIQSYIHTELLKGTSVATIRRNLLQQGWPMRVVTHAAVLVKDLHDSYADTAIEMLNKGHTAFSTKLTLLGKGATEQEIDLMLDAIAPLVTSHQIDIEKKSKLDHLKKLTAPKKKKSTKKHTKTHTKKPHKGTADNTKPTATHKHKNTNTNLHKPVEGKTEKTHAEKATKKSKKSAKEGAVSKLAALKQAAQSSLPSQQQAQDGTGKSQSPAATPIDQPEQAQQTKEQVPNPPNKLFSKSSLQKLTSLVKRKPKPQEAKA